MVEVHWSALAFCGLVVAGIFMLIGMKVGHQDYHEDWNATDEHNPYRSVENEDGNR